MPSPVYLFTGFLDSGKTTLIKDTLNDKNFMEGIDRTLIICLEQGEVEYDEAWRDSHNVFVEYLDSIEELTPERMKEWDTIYHPSQIFIEYNGSEAINTQFLATMPDFWPLVEILSTVDATTFESFINNMRGIMFEQLRYSDVVIVNRCTPETNGRMLRGNIKAINRRAQIFYEGAFGEKVELKSGTLPFDINAPVIDIKDDDYGLWYMDCMEHPEKYANKNVIIRGIYSENIPGYSKSFIIGRQAMVCCAADTNLCGLTVTGVDISQMKIGDWIEVEGELKPVDMENGGKTVVLYAKRCQFYPPMEDPYVYFS
ncbi:MAG: hypothetical protein J6D38_07805 [Solobacterium sp.]|nr:hypothetical protein [Solobacterium sp.]MBR3347780.1 hypothetical protein [Solobacterium sp.]